MKWLKIRTRHAHGNSKWDYKPLYVEKINEEVGDWVQKIVELRNRDYDWSDKFRGVEYFVINAKQVPNSKILKICEDFKRDIEYAKYSITLYTNRLAEIEKLNNKGRKTDPDEIERAKRKKILKEAMEKNRKERK